MHEQDEEPSEHDTLADDLMNAEQPPPEPFTLLLPARIRGYGFHNKKWSAFNSYSIGLLLITT